MSATGDARGFTLIETLVVVAVTALIAGLAFPAVGSAIRGQEFRTGEAQLVAGLRAARAQAVRTGNEATFAVADNGRGFAIAGGAAQAIDSGLTIAAIDRPVIRFYADGTSNGGRLTLAGAARRADVTVYPSTGLAVVVARR